jgi:translation elongation factor EF-G
MIKDRLGARPVVLQLPIGAEEKFSGIVDLISMKAVVWEEESLGAKFHEEPIPEGMAAQAEEYREKLLEAAADCDEAIMEMYLEGKEIGEIELRAIRTGALSLKVSRCVRPPSATRAFSRCSMRSWTFCRRLSISHRLKGSSPAPTSRMNGQPGMMCRSRR